jgi:hypothetical protein
MKAIKEEKRRCPVPVLLAWLTNLAMSKSVVSSLSITLSSA